MARVRSAAISKPEGIGARLVAARKRAGLSREALAFHAGLSWSAIAQVESGRRTNVRPSTLSSLARVLGLSVDYLVDGVAPRTMLEHRALVYKEDETFVEAAAPFLLEGMERSEALMAVTSKRNVELLRRRLGTDRSRVEFAESRAWYASPSAALNGYRDFLEARLRDGAPWVRIIGEPMWEAQSKSAVRRWARYESLLNLAFASSAATVLCPYDARVLDSDVVRQAHATHPQTIENGELIDSSEFCEPAQFMLEH
jgi:transcriptional regulator with XRE-family HTH domain